MELPEGLLTVKGTKATSVVRLLGSDGRLLREYSTVNSRIYTTCLVPTSPGDIVTALFVLQPEVADFVNLVVDGIRRDSASTSGPEKSFNRIFKRACHQGKHKNGKTGGLKSCTMEVQSRNADKGEIRAYSCKTKS